MARDEHPCRRVWLHPDVICLGLDDRRGNAAFRISGTTSISSGGRESSSMDHGILDHRVRHHDAREPLPLRSERYTHGESCHVVGYVAVGCRLLRSVGWVDVDMRKAVTERER